MGRGHTQGIPRSWVVLSKKNPSSWYFQPFEKKYGSTWYGYFSPVPEIRTCLKPPSSQPLKPPSCSIITDKLRSHWIAMKVFPQLEETLRALSGCRRYPKWLFFFQNTCRCTKRLENQENLYVLKQTKNNIKFLNICYIMSSIDTLAYVHTYTNPCNVYIIECNI